MTEPHEPPHTPEESDPVHGEGHPVGAAGPGTGGADGPATGADVPDLVDPGHPDAPEAAAAREVDPPVSAHGDPGSDPDTSGADPRVADAVRRLEGLADRPTEEHVEVYDDVHRTLHDVLSDAESADGPDDRSTDGPAAGSADGPDPGSTGSPDAGSDDSPDDGPHR